MEAHEIFFTSKKFQILLSRSSLRTQCFNQTSRTRYFICLVLVSPHFFCRQSTYPHRLLHQSISLKRESPTALLYRTTNDDGDNKQNTPSWATNHYYRHWQYDDDDDDDFRYSGEGGGRTRYHHYVGLLVFS